MKKFFVFAAVLISFLLGNVSMLMGIIKLFGEEAVKALLGDTISRWVGLGLFGEKPTQNTPDKRASVQGRIKYNESPMVRRWYPDR